MTAPYQSPEDGSGERDSHDAQGAEYEEHANSTGHYTCVH